MIYLQITDRPQVLAVPRSDGHAEVPGVLALVLIRGGVETRFEELLNDETNALYYILHIEDASRLVVGEYDYTLVNETGEELSCGILTAGDYVHAVTAPNGERKIIEYGG